LAGILGGFHHDLFSGRYGGIPWQFAQLFLTYLSQAIFELGIARKSRQMKPAPWRLVPPPQPMNKRHAIYFVYLVESFGVDIYSMYSLKSWSVNISPFWKYIFFSSLIAGPKRLPQASLPSPAVVRNEHRVSVLIIENST
jgi:hypothetical protein